MIVQCLLLFYLNVYLSIAVTIDLKSSSSTVSLDEGDSLRIFYPDLDNYQFFYPNNTKDIETSATNKDKSTTTLSGKIVGIFERVKTVCGDTGWYGYAKFNSGFLNYTDPDDYWVYVYVKSPKKLFVNRKNSMSFLLGKTSDEITIPCRPTSPDFTVELFHNENRVLNDKRVSFDPKKGFSIGKLIIRDIGGYMCKINYKNYEEEISFFLTVISKMKQINQPVISSHDRRIYVIKGQDLQLNCSVEIESNILFSLFWLTFNTKKFKDITEKYFENPLGMHFYQKVKQLTVRNVSDEDQGSYKCCIESGSTTKCDTRFITVQDPTLEYLNITSQDLDIDYAKRCNQSISWIVGYDAYPSPTIRWIHPKYQTITSHDNSNYIIVLRNRRVLLQIKVLSESDIGIHQLILTNRMNATEINFHLHVSCD